MSGSIKNDRADDSDLGCGNLSLKSPHPPDLGECLLHPLEATLRLRLLLRRLGVRMNERPKSAVHEKLNRARVRSSCRRPPPPGAFPRDGFGIELKPVAHNTVA